MGKQNGNGNLVIVSRNGIGTTQWKNGRIRAGFSAMELGCLVLGIKYLFIVFGTLLPDVSNISKLFLSFLYT